MVKHKHSLAKITRRYLINALIFSVRAIKPNDREKYPLQMINILNFPHLYQNLTLPLLHELQHSTSLACLDL
jgi:hypothetical protein